jgi:hypothetical protein
MKLFRKKSDLYLSDRPPLSPLGVFALILTYAIIIMWAIAIFGHWLRCGYQPSMAPREEG